MARFLFLILCVAGAVAASPTAADEGLTVYDVLESYGFPEGLLPLGVGKYEIDSATGKFSVYLNKTCSFTIQGYELKYRSTITGTISRNRITNLSGIQVKVLFFWLNIVRVSKVEDELEFSVGILSADFPVDSFEESPQCGCGFNCVNLKGGARSWNLRTQGILSA